MKETYSDLMEECEHDYLERKDEIAKKMEMEKERLDKDITEMRYQRQGLHEFQKLLEGTATNIESDFIKRIETKLEARVTTMLDDEKHKNSGYGDSFNQDIDYLRCDLHDLQQIIPSVDTIDRIDNLITTEELNRTEIERLSSISNTLLDRVYALEQELKNEKSNSTSNTTGGHPNKKLEEKPKKQLFENVNLNRHHIDGHRDDQPGHPYGLKSLLPYPEESRVQYKFLNGTQQGQECYILSSADREDDTRWYNAITNNNTIVSFPESCVTEVIKIPQTANTTASIQHHSSPLHQAPSVGSPAANPYGTRSPFQPAPYLREHPDQTNFGREYRLHEDEFTYFVGGTGTTKVTKRVKENQLTSFDKAPDRIVVLPTRNGKEFYNSLRRLVISPYNIPLVDWWSQITDAKNILDLDPFDTGNYESARQVMARALYRDFRPHHPFRRCLG